MSFVYFNSFLFIQINKNEAKRDVKKQNKN